MKKVSKAPAHHTKRIAYKLASDRDIQLEHDMRKSSVAQEAHTEYGVPRFVSERNLYHHDYLFSPGLYDMGLGESVVEALLKIPRGKGKVLDVLEDGPGVGNFSVELKRELGKAGVQTHSEVVDLHYAEELAQRERAGEIDKVHNTAAEFFTPKKRYHAIFSMMGSVHYVIDAFRKDVLLKYASSLRKGGLMMVGFHFEQDHSKGWVNMSITKGLSQNPKRSRKMPIKQEMRGIVRSFAKRGYRAKFVTLEDMWRRKSGLPKYGLIIQRIK